MLDLKLLQNDFENISKKLKKKGVGEELLKELQKLFVKLKETRQTLENLQSVQNAKSKLFPQYKKEGKDISILKKELDENKEKIASTQSVVRDLEEELSIYALNIPNIPDDIVPVGKDEEDNVEIKKVLDIPTFEYKPKEHWELGVDLEWIDFERGVKLAKSRFSVLKNNAATISRALINYMIDFNKNRGFKEVALPYIVNRDTLIGTGQLPKFEDDLFKIEGEDLFLIPTAEVPLTNLFRDEILKADELPIKLTAFTPCFRKEAGSAGRDTRGIIRQHQFDKVELVAIT